MLANSHFSPYAAKSSSIRAKLLRNAASGSVVGRQSAVGLVAIMIIQESYKEWSRKA
jgi:hypothetical protein